MVKLQEFGNLRAPDGDELLIGALDDGTGVFTDHRFSLASIITLALARNDRGVYDPTATYGQSDTVRYDDGTGVGTYLHYSDVPSTGLDPTNTNKWALLARDGIDGVDGDDGTNGINGTDGTDGAISAVQGNGSALPVRPILNFINASIADDPANNKTDINVGASSGDMAKSIYDTDDDGVVNTADIAIELDGTPTTDQFWGYNGTSQGFFDVPGDMAKATYDTNDDGVVDIATALDGTPTTGQIWSFDGTSQGFVDPPGDMKKSVYDANDDGIVDVAATLDGTPITGQIWGYNGTSQGFFDPGAGSGDMAKAVYDTNDDGTVDSADVAIEMTGTPTIGQVWGYDGTAQGFIDPPPSGGSIIRQETTPAPSLDTFWIVPSTNRLYFYDPGSTNWINV